jgi:3-methyladenine DNA glycosylase AlkD
VVNTTLDKEVQAVLAALEQLGSQKILDDMRMRYGIYVEKAFGVPMAAMQKVAKRHGQNHELALALWDTGWYEARTVAALVDDPASVTAGQMDRWCRDFDNWAICDTVCFKLFDRTPHAFHKVEQWASRRGEFVRRGAFALLACLALHDKQAGDDQFVRCLPLIEEGASDERNFVKKGVSWALRAIGGRSLELHSAIVTLARRLAASPEAAPRWVGKDVIKDLTRPIVTQRMEARRAASSRS